MKLAARGLFGEAAGAFSAGKLTLDIGQRDVAGGTHDKEVVEDIGGLGGESQFPQVRGNVFRGAGGVVGDEQGAGVGGFQRRDRPFGWSMAPEQGAVQVEQ